MSRSSAVEIEMSTQSTLSDLERDPRLDITQISGRQASELDPYSFRKSLISHDDLAEIRSRKKHGKSLGKFYDGQNEHISNLLRPMAMMSQDAADAQEASALKVKIAIRASFILNFVLSVVQIYAAASSLSLSLFATAIDSVFDPFSNWLLNWLHKKGVNADPLKWPVGGSRFETIGNIVYGFLMGAVNMILVVESIRSLATHDSEESTTKLHIPALVSVGSAFIVKLGLFFYCLSVRSQSSQVQVLWEDHRNDLLVNGFGILTSAAGSKIVWWLDPGGAIIIASIIIISWTRTVYTEFLLLAGKAADSEMQQLVIYKAMTFNPEIQKIDSCRVYYSGPAVIIEVDLVMPADTPLWKAHDISQDLQDQLEALPDVDRAFVHVDHEVLHKLEHGKDK